MKNALVGLLITIGFCSSTLAQTPTGACCFPSSGGCLEVTSDFCFLAGGVYQGDNSSCYPNPCGTPNPPDQWADNFESYANGTSMYHVGGWSGWDDNSAAAGTISDAFAHGGSNSIAVHDTSDAIHPFSGMEGGQWVMTTWQYIPSGLSGVTYFVVNSYYQDYGPYYWTVELHFDPEMSKVYDALRDPSATSGVPIVYDQWVPIRLEIDLDAFPAGTISQYYNDQLVYAGSWIVGVVGQLAIANIDLYAPHPEFVYYDDFNLNRPVPPPPIEVARPVFAGVEYGGLRTRTTDLSGFPGVTWKQGFAVAVNGAAGRPDGAVYISSGDFSTKLSLAPLEGPAIQLASLQYDISGLAYGNGHLYGFANYASPMGIYEINPTTGAMTLAVDTSAQGYRYFAMDFNTTDGLIYGYTEYGSPDGLHSIDPVSGTITPIAGSTPAENSAARGMACGNNTVYLISVYGNTGTPMYAYDLAQGHIGTWTPFAHPFPESNSTSGGAWAAAPVAGDVNRDGIVDLGDLATLLGSYGLSTGDPGFFGRADLDGNGTVDLGDLSTQLAHYGMHW